MAGIATEQCFEGKTGAISQHPSSSQGSRELPCMPHMHGSHLKQKQFSDVVIASPSLARTRDPVCTPEKMGKHHHVSVPRDTALID